ncbi:MAG: biopolymer transporter ExbD [Myxococcota bacterium]
MGGAAPVEGGKGKKKSLDAVINLVPFIDLLSSLIAFLLMTAVWTQIATLQVGQQGSNNPTPPPPDEDKKVTLNLTVTERGFNLSTGAEQLPIEKAGNDYNFDELNKKLNEIKANAPDINDVKVQAEDGVQYDVLVRVIDSCLGARMLNVMLTSATST